MDTIFVNVEGRELLEDAPAGFWEQSPELRIAYIQAKWPQANWAGNGRPGLYAAYHFLTPVPLPGTRQAAVKTACAHGAPGGKAVAND